MDNSVCHSPYAAYLQYTGDLLAAPDHRVHQHTIAWTLSPPFHQDRLNPPSRIRHWLDAQYVDGQWQRFDRDMTYTTWNVNVIFPVLLWEEHGFDLASMLEDPRLFHPPAHKRRDNWSSDFGRMCMPRPGLRVGFGHYMLERMRNPYYRSQPVFHFDLEGSAYVFEPMINNPRVVKHQRVYTTCVMQIAFKLEAGEDRLYVSLIMRSNKWTHIYGDIFGASYIATAVCKELGIGNWQAAIFIPSGVGDDVTVMRGLLREAAERQ